jgi:RNA polymerase sigma-70 factor (ECF subfamily)
MTLTVECVDTAFDEIVRRHERELHVHCYRMVGSFEAAQDVVQETFLRAWRARDSFDGEVVEGGPGVRAWLYRIATNACLDELRRTSRRPTDSVEVSWLQPYPDRLLDEVGPTEQEPDAVVIARETIELAFLVATQLLPPRQRAVLLLRDVLGWSAVETAEALELSVASANSALQRARTSLRDRLPARRSDWSVTAPSESERELAQRFIEAHERADAAASLALASADIRVTMPPHPWCFDGLDALGGLMEQAFGPQSLGEWRLVPTAANRQPAAASYLRQPGESEYRAFKLDVLRVRDGRIAEITTFSADLFPAFGLPGTLSPRSVR